MQIGPSCLQRILQGPVDRASSSVKPFLECKANLKTFIIVQLHAAPDGKFIGINYDYTSHPCLPEAEVRLPSELSFPESSTVAVWMPTPVPVLRKTESSFAEGKMLDISLDI